MKKINTIKYQYYLGESDDQSLIAFVSREYIWVYETDNYELIEKIKLKAWAEFAHFSKDKKYLMYHDNGDYSFCSYNFETKKIWRKPYDLLTKKSFCFLSEHRVMFNANHQKIIYDYENQIETVGEWPLQESENLVNITPWSDKDYYLGKSLNLKEGGQIFYLISKEDQSLTEIKLPFKDEILDVFEYIEELDMYVNYTYQYIQFYDRDFLLLKEFKEGRSMGGTSTRLIISKEHIVFNCKEHVYILNHQLEVEKKIDIKSPYGLTYIKKHNHLIVTERHSYIYEID